MANLAYASPAANVRKSNKTEAPRPHRRCTCIVVQPPPNAAGATTSAGAGIPGSSLASLQPLEERSVTISRVLRSTTFPAEFFEGFERHERITLNDG